MFKRVVHLTAISLLFLPLTACSSGADDPFASFSSTQTSFTTLPPTTTMTMEADGSGEASDSGDGDPSTGDGDGDGDPSTGDGDPTGCPPGQFGCPCDNGVCDAGLECIDGECALPSGDGDPTTSTTGNGNDPYDPATCMAPSELVTITGVTGELCSPLCSVDADCPMPSAGMAACALVLEGAMNPTNCAIICQIGNNATCPAGATCKDAGGTGVCTYP